MSERTLIGVLSKGGGIMKQTKNMVAINDISVMSDSGTQRAIVLKEEKDATRQLVMFVGESEFVSIAKEKGLVKAQRPLTHDFYMGFLEKLPITFVRVEIFTEKKGTFYARVLFRSDGKDYVSDSRPSDAIALALKTKTPVMVNEALLRPTLNPEIMKEYQIYIKRCNF